MYVCIGAYVCTLRLLQRWMHSPIITQIGKIHSLMVKFKVRNTDRNSARIESISISRVKSINYRFKRFRIGSPPIEGNCVREERGKRGTRGT